MEGSAGSGLGSAEGLMGGKRLLEGQRGFLGHKGLAGLLALLECAEAGFDPLGELLAALTRHAFHRFLHTAVGTDAETDRALGHPGKEGVGGC